MIHNLVKNYKDDLNKKHNIVKNIIIAGHSALKILLKLHEGETHLKNVQRHVFSAFIRHLMQ